MHDGPVTRLLRDAEEGDDAARGRIVELLHGELRRIASAHMNGERPDHTLQPTALINEAYLRLFREQPVAYANRAHFLASASRAMRQILVDSARRRRADKRGGGRVRITLTTLTSGPPQSTSDAVDLVALSEALDRLARVDELWSRLVELRFFGGLTAGECADALGVSEPTVHRAWKGARAWLFRALQS